MCMDLKKKSKTWSCKEGCLQGKRPCKHLEKLLPDPNKGAIGPVIKDGLQTLQESDTFNFEEKAGLLEKKLLSTGLEKFRVDIIMDRFISRFTLAEIAERRGYVSSSAVQYLLKSSLVYLKSCGNRITAKLLGDYNG